MTYIPPPVTSGALRLHYNENTAGCSPAVIAALQRLTPEDIAFYPESDVVTAKTESWLGVGRGWVHLTNGLDEGIQLAALWARVGKGRTRSSPEPSVIVSEPAFEMYAVCAEAVGADVVRVDPRPDFEFPLAEILRAITPATRVIYLTDPNNPTGLPIPVGAVERIANAAPNAIVMVDEAYADFSGRTLIGRVLDLYPNLVVGRTFAKAYGLAGLRAGALVAQPQTIDALRQLAPPFSVNVCTLHALTAAFEDRSHLDWSVAQAAESRDRLYTFCRRHGLTYWPSQANFVLVRVGDDAPAIVSALADRGIMVRDKSGAPGCAGCVRITTGVVAHTERALDALEEILASRTR